MKSLVIWLTGVVSLKYVVSLTATVKEDHYLTSFTLKMNYIIFRNNLTSFNSYEYVAYKYNVKKYVFLPNITNNYELSRYHLIYFETPLKQKNKTIPLKQYGAAYVT